MHITDVSPVDLLLAGCGTLLVLVFAFAALAFEAWRRATRLQSQHLATHSQTLEQQLSALDARVNAAATAIRRLDERIERQAPPAAPAPGAPAAPGYQIAIRLARSGASCEELVGSCGLTLGEAELVQRLHGLKQRRAGV